MAMTTLTLAWPVACTSRLSPSRWCAATTCVPCSIARKYVKDAGIEHQNGFPWEGKEKWLACGMYLETVTVTLVRCNNMRALLDCNKIC